MAERAAMLCKIRYAIFFHLDETGLGDRNTDKLNSFLLTAPASNSLARSLYEGHSVDPGVGYPIFEDWWIAFQVHAFIFSALRVRLVHIQKDMFTPAFSLASALRIEGYLASSAQQIPKAVIARSPPEWVLREALPKALKSLLYGTELLEMLEL